MKPLYSGVLLLASVYFNAQTTAIGKVGINTITPKETLDVNGTLKVGNYQPMERQMLSTMGEKTNPLPLRLLIW